MGTPDCNKMIAGMTKMTIVRKKNDVKSISIQSLLKTLCNCWRIAKHTTKLFAATVGGYQSETPFHTARHSIGPRLTVAANSCTKSCEVYCGLIDRLKSLQQSGVPRHCPLTP